MDLSRLFNALAEHLASDAFLNTARHPEHPAAFSRRRKLPLSALVANLVCGMCKSVQAELDAFFGSLQAQAQSTQVYCKRPATTPTAAPSGVLSLSR